MGNNKNKKNNKNNKSKSSSKVNNNQKNTTKKVSNTNNQKQNVKETQDTNNKKNKKINKKGRKKMSIWLKIFLWLFVLGIIAVGVGIAVFANIFFSDKWTITKDDLIISLENTMIYDSEGVKIAEIAGDENRKIVSLEEIGDYVTSAFIAIEDQRYYSHFGVDIQRTAAATISYVTNGGESTVGGGSTITQQLVKNMMNDDATLGSDGVERKIREWSRAYQIEQMLSKTQILELYLNKIFMGSTVYGVESAAIYYFSKSANELSIAEAAFIAGINHAPNGYAPFADEPNMEKINTRTLLVISQMEKLQVDNVSEMSALNAITKEEFAAAKLEVEEGLNFKKGTITDNSNISFHTAAAIEEVIREIMDEKEVNYETAEYILKNGGYSIYTTQVTSIQEVLEEEYLKDDYIKAATTTKGKENEEHSQSASVIIDHTTGNVVAVVGGLGEDSLTYGLNRATQSYMQPGSAMKPLAALAPGLENKVITAATVYDDSPTYFGSMTFNNSTGYPGLISVRAAIERSSNIVNMKVLSNVGVNTSVAMLNEFGLDQYDDADKSITLALGGTTHGASPLQMAAAYATIANAGTYIEPTFYSKVETSSGSLAYESEQETRRVLSEQNAYVLVNLLKSPVYGFNGSATATRCAIPGMETAAKTGTTSDTKDLWLCGMTPYYAMATWFGYDEPETISFRVNGSPVSQSIWSTVMKEIHTDLEKANFTKPSGITTASICKATGLKATSKCTSKYTETFVTGTVPDECSGHEAVSVCKDSDCLATDYCPSVEKKYLSAIPEKEIKPAWVTEDADEKYNMITETCTEHTKETMTVTVVDVTGKTEADAKASLANLTIVVQYSEDKNKQEGIVLSQSVAVGEVLTKGASITITINKITVVEPEPEPEPEEPEVETSPDDTVENTTPEV